MMLNRLRGRGLRAPSLASCSWVRARRSIVPGPFAGGALRREPPQVAGHSAPAAAWLRMTSVAVASLCFRGESVAQLQQWLDLHGVDTACYGQGVSKTVVDLLEEASKNESVLDVEDGRAVRIVRVLSMHIRNEQGQILFEQEQILPDGRSRIRNVALSEKLVGEEPWQDAVGRAIQEELGTVLPEGYEVTLFPETYQMLSQVSPSMSYPNLPTKYIFHRVSANVTGLPQGPFSTYEERPGGKLITRWVWRYESEVPSDMLASS